ncbi:hypothetical protein AURDEDRAFT_158232 [Auricularia subglabra TFB-10046 SS5]|nr:hypothetical protein AURDEDRAFT_158232 [Auricularia subglabra TFB-10046 SS5]
MPTIHYFGVFDPFRYVGCSVTAMLFGLVRFRLARREAWFTPDTLSDKALTLPTTRVPPMNQTPWVLAVALWAVFVFGVNVQFLFDTVQAFKAVLARAHSNGVLENQMVHFVLILLATLLLQSSLRVLYNVFKGRRAPTETAFEQYQYCARVYMLDGVWLPVLLLAYGDVKNYAHAAQSLAWVFFIMWSLFASNGFAEAQAALKGAAPLETV